MVEVEERTQRVFGDDFDEELLGSERRSMGWDVESWHQRWKNYPFANRGVQMPLCQEPCGVAVVDRGWWGVYW